MAFRESEQRNDLSLEVCRGASQNASEEEVYAELLRLLPLAQNAKDKVSLVKLLVAYLRCRCILDKVDGNIQDTLSSLLIGDSQANSLNLDNFGRRLSNSMLESAVEKVDELRRAILDITPPCAGTELHEHSPDIQHEKLERYKESLLEGMREFLGPMPSDVEGLSLGQSVISGHGELSTLRSSTSTLPRNNMKKQTTEMPVKSLKKDKRGKNTLCVDKEEKGQLTQRKTSDFCFRLDKLPPIAFEGSLMLEAAGGFLMMLNSSLEIVSASDNVFQYLGYSQYQLIGQHINAFLLPEDVPQFQKHIGLKEATPADVDLEPDGIKKTFYMVLKHRLVKGDCRLAGSSVYQWNVRLIHCGYSRTASTRFDGMICLCRRIEINAIPYWPNISNIITVIESLDFKVIRVEGRVEELTGYRPEEVIQGTSYNYKHPFDIFVLRHTHEMVLAHGEADSGYYRCYNKNGVPFWFFSRLKLVEPRRANRPSYVHMTNYIVSAKEAENVLCQDEEEYKRFKCEGFGRIYDTKYKNQPLRSCNTKSKLSNSLQTDCYGGFQNTTIGSRCKQHVSFSKTTQPPSKCSRISQNIDSEGTNFSKSNHTASQYSNTPGSDSPDFDLGRFGHLWHSSNSLLSTSNGQYSPVDSQLEADGSPMSGGTFDSDPLLTLYHKLQSSDNSPSDDFNFLKGNYSPQVEEIEPSITIGSSDFISLYDNGTNAKHINGIMPRPAKTTWSPLTLEQTSFDFPQLDADIVDKTLNTIDIANVSPLNCRNMDSLSEEDCVLRCQPQTRQRTNKCSSCLRSDRPRTSLGKLLEEDDDSDGSTSPCSSSSTIILPSMAL